ncbi:hypothetical protein ACHAW5_008173 [Stephanodiscus triporus]|uniref:CHASE domain-containing protein n=1 Tax=Stephanodiscus triporus TaxID=2934178 RepID=A0ABD3NFV9_9STRA
MTMTLDKYDDPRAVPLPHHGRDHGHDAPTIEPSAPPLSELDAEESTTADYSMPCALAKPVPPPALAPRHHYSTRVVATPVTANDDTVERRVERTYEPDGSLSVEVVTTTARRADGSREVRIENYRIPAEDAWGLADGRSPGDEYLTRVEVRSLPPGVVVDFGTTASSSSTQERRVERRNQAQSLHSSVDAAVPVEDAHEVARRHQEWRVCIRGALVVAAAVVTTFAGLYAKTDGNANFEMQYTDSVEKVGEQFQYRLDVKRDSLMTLSYMITSRYGPLGVWPNVTIPDFQEQTDGILRIANGRALSFNPIITQDVNRLEWEAHATESAWILGGEDSILVVPDPNATWPDNRTVSFGIYSRDADMNVIYDPGYDPDSEDYSDVMVPVWQIAPFAGNERAVMFNLHSEINRMQALDNMMTYGVPSLTAILQLVQDKDFIRPSAILFYPVFDAFGSTEVVGSVSLVFSWDTFFSSILPDYIKGVVCVLSASTGQVYSYTISGDHVDLMGEGDLHDPNYDEYKEEVEARLLLEGEDDAGKFITYTLTMYPSEEFEDQYSTNKPAVYAVWAVLIFLFAAGLFKTSHLATQRGRR